MTIGMDKILAAIAAAKAKREAEDTPVTSTPTKPLITVSPSDDPAPMHQWVDDFCAKLPNIILDGKEFNA